MINIYDPANREKIQEVLRQGQVSEFWQLLCALIDEDVIRSRSEMMSDDLLGLPAEEYKVRMEALKNQINDREALKVLPKAYIIELDESEKNEEDSDPYE